MLCQLSYDPQKKLGDKIDATFLAELHLAVAGIEPAASWFLSKCSFHVVDIGIRPSKDPGNKVDETTGFEPATLADKASAFPLSHVVTSAFARKNGAGIRIRTGALRFCGPPPLAAWLYPLEIDMRGRSRTFIDLFLRQVPLRLGYAHIKNADAEIRTRNLLFRRQTLFDPLSYIRVKRFQGGRI